MLTPDPAKQCYHCQGLGHVQADCPTLRLSGGSGGGRCYSCGQMGHLAVRFCESRIKGDELTRSSATVQARTPPHQQVAAAEDLQEEATAAASVVDLLVAIVQRLATSVVDQTTSLATARLRP